MADETVTVDFWDVGQGDATTIELPDGRFVLIDTGPWGSPIIDWLQKRPKAMPLVIITHNDKDHAGALPALVGIPGMSFETIYMLEDRAKTSRPFQKIWRPVREKENLRLLKIIRLEADRTLWQSGDYRLDVIHPNFSENVEARQPNRTSAIICLYYKDAAKIIWPGDAPLRTVAKKCARTEPYLLHGPHHGAPVDRKRKYFPGRLSEFIPARVLISVGSKNTFGHPCAKYIGLQVARGCNVICTQLTEQCDSHRVSNQQPVVDSARYLGLVSPRTGVPCRGCLRLTIKDGAIQPDELDSEHSEKVRYLTNRKCRPIPSLASG